MIPLCIPLRNRVGGRIRVQVCRDDGSVRLDTGWFKNLITNTGLDMLGAPAAIYVQADTTAVARCTVGTGNTPPSFTDTSLVAPLGYTAAALNDPSGPAPRYGTSYVVGPPDYISCVGTHTFALGQIVGNIAEVGLGGLVNNTSTQLLLFSRALILDGGGSPTTITVTAADQLIVTYELRLYFDLTDTTYSLTISGTGYSGTIRRANTQTAPLPNTVICVAGTVANPNCTLTPYNGTIGAVTGYPSGTAGTTITGTLASYTSGTYFTTMTFSYSISQGNLSGGITALLLATGGVGAWQLSVSPALAKDATKTMSLVFNVSWARYP